MKTKKLNFSEMKNALSRSEMKQIMAGSSGCTVKCNDNSGGPIDTCYRAPDYCLHSGGELSCTC